LQSSRSLLQGDVHLSEQNDSEKDVKSHLAEAENISSLDKDLIKQQSETFNDQNQVERFDKNPSNNESLVNCGTLLTEHVTKPSVEKSSPETEECDSSSFQKRVVLTPGKVNKLLIDFFEDGQVKKAALENGLNGKLFHQIFQEFRKKILSQMKSGNKEMLKVFRKSYYGSDHATNLFPLFLAFARQVHPMLNCIDEVKKISDLRGPADLFPKARAIKRKVIYHAGPTNSGKTHSALERFRSADSGVYCGPLRLLATEVFRRTNDAGIPCDLLTGEDRQWAISPDEPANHIAATIEMCSTSRPYDCAVIDEIQMMNDNERGWAWTRALLGLPCHEIHVCGESSAIDVVQRLVSSCNDEMEIHRYERLSPLNVRHDISIDRKFGRVKPGDCVVAFSQKDLYNLRREIEKKSKHKCAIIYGNLPPATKVEQANKFNNPEDECSVLVASDAVGMGLNLNIKRIVFSTLTKFDGRTMVQLTSSQAKQIAGRAGRYGSNHPNGEALTFRKEDSKVLHSLVSAPTQDIKAAGLAPSMEQIEMLSEQLLDASLLKLYEVFESVVQLDGANYFMCDLEFKKKIAHKLRGIALSITEQYVFSTAPISTKTIELAVKFAQYVSDEMALTSSTLRKINKWPPKKPRSLEHLQNLEALHEGLDLYLWLSYRFSEIFVDLEEVCEMQQHVEGIIGEAVSSNKLGSLTTQWQRRRSSIKQKKFVKWLRHHGI